MAGGALSRRLCRRTRGSCGAGGVSRQPARALHHRAGDLRRRRRAPLCALSATETAGAAGISSQGGFSMSTNETGSNSASSDASTSTAALALSDEAKRNLVESKVACPFLGSAIAQGTLAARTHPDNPLASIEQVRELGNSGGERTLRYRTA